MPTFSWLFSLCLVFAVLVFGFFLFLPADVKAAPSWQESLLQAKMQLLQGQVELLKAQISLLLRGVPRQAALGEGREGVLTAATSSFSPDNVRVRPDIETETGTLYPTLQAWSRAGTSGGYTPVMSFDIKALLSDITIKRVDVFFDTRPWLYLDKVKLSFGYWDFAEKEAKQGAFTEIEAGRVYQLRFDGLNATVQKGTTATLTVIVDPKEFLLVPLPKDINVFLENNSIRGIDTAGIWQFAPLSDGGKGGAFSRTFRIEVP